MSRVDDTLNRLQELDATGQGHSLEAIHIRDQLNQAAHRAFMKTIAPSFKRPDGSYPEWITKHQTNLGPPWTDES